MLDVSSLPEEYRIAIPVVRATARDFGYEITPEEAGRMVTAVVTSHGIDKAFDAITDPEEVSRLVRLTLSFIQTGDGRTLGDITAISPDMPPPLEALRAMAEEHDVTDALHSLSEKIFAVMQRTRTTSDPHEFIREKVREAELSADMAFLFTLKEASEPLKTFLKELTIALNLLDDFNDAEEDHEAQLMAFEPTLRFKFSTLFSAMDSLWKALKLHPKPGHFLWRMRSRSNFQPE